MLNVKKTMLKALISVLCTVAMIVSSCGFAVGAKAEDDSFDYATFLNRMGISVVWDEENYMTRGDFVALAVQALGIDAATGESFFSDVSGVQGQYINIAAQMGLVSKSSDGKFYPDRIIVSEEAAAICMRALGYGEILKGESYPEGYLKFASRIKLLENVSAGSKLTGADATKIVFNMLDSEYLSPNYYNENKVTYTLSDNTYGQDRFGLYEGRGYIQSICGLFLGGINATDKEEIIIDGAVYSNPYYNDFNYYTYLGREVKFYVLNTADAAEVIYIAPADEQLRIDSNDIENVVGFDSGDGTSAKKNPKLSYSNKENNRTNTVNIASDATFLVNGKVTNKISNSVIAPDFGTVYLTDSDNDKTYDVVLIENHKYYKIEYYNANDACLNDSYGQEHIRLDEFKSEDVVVLSDGKVVGLEAIPSKGILQIMCTYDDAGNIDYNGFIRINVVTDRIKGSIESIDGNDFYIDGKAYRALPHIKNELVNRIGFKTTFTIGENNVITDYDPFADSSALQYGYLVGIESTTFDKEVKFFLLTEDDEVVGFKKADEMKYTGMYNGKYSVGRKLKNKEVKDVIAPYQVVKFQTDDNDNIVLMELADDKTVDPEYKGFEENRFTLDYKESCKLYSTWVGSDYKSSSSTIYFYVKPGSRDFGDYRTGDYMTYGLTHSNNLNVSVYDASRGLNAKVVVVENLKTEGKVSDTFINSGTTNVVTDVRRGLNKEGYDSSFIYVTDGGKIPLFPVDENLAPSNNLFLNVSTNVQKFSDLEPGDVITYFLNKKGEIYRYIVLYDYDETHAVENMVYESIGSLDGMDDSGAFRRTSGIVDKYYPGGHFVVDAVNRENLKFDLSVSGAKFFEVDTKNRTVKVQSTVPALNKGDFVWVYLYRKTTKVVVRYI